MKITSSKFIISVGKTSIENPQLNLQQIAFVGRSNVGKSSLINALCNHSKLCKTSNTPGRTRLINYFLINDKFYFVDLPGYGFAQASKTEVSSWQSLIDPYLTNNPNLKCICVLVDIRHKPSVQDKQMIDYLVFHGLPFIVIATKSDKLGKSQIKPQLQVIASELKMAIANIYAISNETKQGRDEILHKLDQFLNF